MMNRLVMTLIILIGYSLDMHASEIAVRLSANKVGLNEPFTAVFSVNQRFSDQPDFSPLLKDFNILSSSAASSTTIINGKVTEEIRWTLNLIAKETGKLTLPAISLGYFTSEPKEIEVTPDSPQTLDDDIFIEIEKKPLSSIYQQTPLLCTVRLYCSLNLTQGKLTELETTDPNAMVERIGADAQYEKFHNGKRYMVVERQYMVVPEQTGELIIKPITFEGYVMGKSYSVFDMQSTFKRATSNPEKIVVKALPDGFNHNKWLAATDLQLTEKWSQDPTHLGLGEPVTWELTVTAEGTIADTIPDFNLNFPKDIKSYIDKPESSDQMTANGMRATKQVKVALIPTKAGEYLLPDLTIEWWDLKLDERREAKISGRTIHVTSENEVAMENPGVPEMIPLTVDEPIRENIEIEETSKLFVALIGLTALLLLLGFYIKTKPKNSKSQMIKQIKGGLKHACRTNDPKKAEKYLLGIAALMFPEIKPLNLKTLKPHLPARLQDEIDELSRHLYGQNDTWDGSALWNAWVAFKPRKHYKLKAKQNEDALKELYPK